MTMHEEEFREDETTPDQTTSQAEAEVLDQTSENSTVRASRATNKDRPRRQPQRRSTDERAIIKLPQAEQRATAVDEEDSDTTALHTLEAQGLTEDEAVRLIHVSDRMKTSCEAREAEATMRRLRFTRWLIQQGMLDEFSA